MLNIALPKGRLGDKVYDMLAAAGYDCPGYYEQNRKLGVTTAQEEAMKIGSMCGWDVPGADPDHCMDIVQQRGGMELG